jgi:hypothetical protein
MIRLGEKSQAEIAEVFNIDKRTISQMMKEVRENHPLLADEAEASLMRCRRLRCHISQRNAFGLSRGDEMLWADVLSGKCHGARRSCFFSSAMPNDSKPHREDSTATTQRNPIQSTRPPGVKEKRHEASRRSGLLPSHDAPRNTQTLLALGKPIIAGLTPVLGYCASELYQSSHHCHTLPPMSYKPNRLAEKLPTGLVLG